MLPSLIWTRIVCLRLKEGGSISDTGLLWNGRGRIRRRLVTFLVMFLEVSPFECSVDVYVNLVRRLLCVSATERLVHPISLMVERAQIKTIVDSVVDLMPNPTNGEGETEAGGGTVCCAVSGEAVRFH